MVGGGFVDGIKVMLEGSDKPPVTAVFSSPSSISCKLHTDEIPGLKNLILIPPSGTSITLKRVLEFTQDIPMSIEDSDKNETDSKPKKKSKT
ncbi:MAG: hypothetical protein IPQ05_19500 [Leptospiraceae bacterium]|nr:hypothetical protein [Leptospiraceae bacterium]